MVGGVANFNNDDYTEIVILVGEAYAEIEEMISKVPFLGADKSLSDDIMDMFLIGIYNGVKNSTEVQRKVLDQAEAVDVEKDVEQSLAEKLTSLKDALKDSVIEARSKALKQLSESINSNTKDDLLKNDIFISGTREDILGDDVLNILSHTIKKHHLKKGDNIGSIAFHLELLKAGMQNTVALVLSNASKIGEQLGVGIAYIHDHSPETIQRFINPESLLKGKIYNQYFKSEFITKLSDAFKILSPTAFFTHAIAGIYEGMVKKDADVSINELERHNKLINELIGNLNNSESLEALDAELQQITNDLVYKIADNNAEISIYKAEIKFNSQLIQKYSLALEMLESQEFIAKIDTHSVSEEDVKNTIKRIFFPAPTDKVVEKLSELIKNHFSKKDEINLADKYDSVIIELQQQKYGCRIEKDKCLKQLKKARQSNYLDKLKEQQNTLEIKKHILDKIRNIPEGSVSSLLPYYAPPKQEELIMNYLFKVQQKIEKQLIAKKIELKENKLGKSGKKKAISNSVRKVRKVKKVRDAF
jgi:hypothetical protein